MQGALQLQDGSLFLGKHFGYPTETSGEVVFSTGMVGYPQSFTDPSFSGQILVLTYPLVGNYGVPGACRTESGLSKRFESDKIHIKGLVVSSYVDQYSHWEARKSLAAWLYANRVPALSGIDTRTLTQKIREKGVMLGRISKFKTQMSKLQLETENFFDPNKENLVEKVSCKKIKVYKNGSKKILLIDCGVKHSIIKALFNLGTTIIRVPWDINQPRLKTAGFSLKDISGVVLSNGPGDPKKCRQTIDFVKILLAGKIPILGICLGNQILALSAGGNTFKLKYGHRSLNQPVRLSGTNRAFITSQNHGYSLKMPSLGSSWQEWFVNLNDGTNEGIRHKRLPFCSVQFHPEGNPGPKDTAWVIEEFVNKLKVKS